MDLELRNVQVKDVVLGDKNDLKDGVLTVDVEGLKKLILEDPRVTAVKVDLAKPGESCRILPVKDVVEPRYKPEGEIFPGVFGSDVPEAGSGVTYVLKGCAVVTTGPIVGFQEGLIDMSGPAAQYTLFSKLNNVVLHLTKREDVDPVSYTHLDVYKRQVHDHGTGLHQLQVLTIDNVILAVLGPQDAVDDDVGLPQALLQIGAVGDHVGDVGGGGLLGGQHCVHVDIQNTHLVAEGGSQLSGAGTYHAAAQHVDDGGLHAGDVGQQLAGAAVDGLGKVQSRQEAALTGQLAHGAQQGELTLLVLHILIGHGGDVAVQQGVRLVRVSVGVDVGEEDLVLVHPLEPLGQQLLDLVVPVSYTHLVRQALTVTEDGCCTVPGRSEKLCGRDAAFVNGISGHELELDDTSSSNLGHPTVAVLPALLAIGEETGCSGRLLLEGFLIATEVTCKLGRICAKRLHAKGWHCSSVTAGIGAAAGCAYLLLSLIHI